MCYYLPIESAKPRIKAIESVMDKLSEITQNIKSKSTLKKIKDRESNKNLPQRSG
jgi:ppGpp synthetase/RelA/SpoT-type nucleotidyltranferase